MIFPTMLLTKALGKAKISFQRASSLEREIFRDFQKKVQIFGFVRPFPRTATSAHGAHGQSAVCLVNFRIF